MKEAIKGLAEFYKDDEEVLDLIALSANNIFDYVARVCYMEARIPILMASKEGADLRYAITTLDQGRRIAHESAISGISILNRLLTKGGKEPLFEAVEDRHAVSDFCMSAIVEFFHNGRNAHKLSISEIIA